MTATAAPKAPSVWEDFIDIFTSPSEVFARRQNGNWFIPMIVVTVLVFAIYLGTKSMTQAVFDAEFARGMQAAMRQNPQLTPDQIEKGKSFAGVAFGAAVLFAVPIATFFVGLCLWVVGKLFDATIGFGAALLVAAYAQFPKIFQPVAGALIAYFSDPSTLTSASKITVSPAHFLDVSTTSPVMLALLTRFDLLTIWCTILVGIGLAVVGKIPRSKAMLAAVIVWALSSVFPLLSALRQM
ncbi:MAG TPA: YIP1 family protein [Gemmatimonadaceae bacterium]|nr:YIP1 family protein [Gemmatimonadaceae bacterium]